MNTKDLKINNFYRLIVSGELITIDSKNDLITIDIGKVCKIHSIGELIEAYWIDDIFKPILIESDEFCRLFSPANVA